MPGMKFTRPVRRPTIEQCEAATGIPARKWVARCYEIATALVEANLVIGRPVYGHWIGPVAPGTHFAKRGRLPFVRHGWILLNPKTGRVLDPTRWVFEGVAPYIYLGKPGKGQPWPYDEGGNRWLTATRIPMPAPDHSQPWGIPKVELGLGLILRKRHGDLPEVMTLTQVAWLANTPYQLLGADAARIYRAIERAGHGALIPIDNRRKAQAELEGGGDAAV